MTNLEKKGSYSSKVEHQFVALTVVGSNPINYPMVFKSLKKKFKKKVLKKKLNFFKTFFLKKVLWLNFTNMNIQNVFCNIIFKKNIFLTNPNQNKTFLLNLNQKNFNTKGCITILKNITMFSVGSVLKYFNLKQGKSARRSAKGVKIFLNFLKNVLLKKFLQKAESSENFALILKSCDYNLFFLKSFFKKVFLKNYKSSGYFLINPCLSFTKKRAGRKKSIKKRLKKNQLENFLKNI